MKVRDFYNIIKDLNKDKYITFSFRPDYDASFNISAGVYEVLIYDNDWEDFECANTYIISNFKNTNACILTVGELLERYEIINDSIHDFELKFIIYETPFGKKSCKRIITKSDSSTRYLYILENDEDYTIYLSTNYFAWNHKKEEN